MATVILVIHLIIAIALVGVVLLQRSEGGGLGMGSGGSFMAGRGQANLLTRTTAVLAAAFFTTSILLSILAQTASQPRSILERLDTSAPAKSGSAPVSPTPSGTPASGTTAPSPAAAPATPPAAPAPPKSQ